MSTSVCKVCNVPLIKQPIDLGNKLPLSEEKKHDNDVYKICIGRTLECESCGFPCYSKTIVKSGIGLCKKCRGNNAINRHKDVPDKHTLKRKEGAMIW